MSKGIGEGLHFLLCCIGVSLVVYACSFQTTKVTTTVTEECEKEEESEKVTIPFIGR